MALDIIENSAGTKLIKCSDCGRFIKAGEFKIAHSKSCDLNEQPTHEMRASISDAPAVAEARKPSARTIANAAKEGAVSAVLSDDEIVDAVRKGFVTMNDAMNRDF